MSMDASATPPAASGPTTDVPLAFHGEGGEYFRIWIVNLALTIVTLGIYSAWAKVRKLRYLYGSTTLAGSSFGYHAPPLKILKGRIIAALLGATYFAATRYSPLATLAVIALIGCAVPWLVVRSRMFAMRMSSWRGIRCGFQPDYAGAYGAFLGWSVLTLLTIGVLYPRAVRERLHFVVSRTRFGGTPFVCNPRTGRFYKTALVALGLALLAITVIVMAIGAVVAAGVLAAKAKGVHVAPGAHGAHGPALWLAQGLGVLGYLVLFSVLHGYTQSRNLNELFGSTTLGPLRFNSRLRAHSLIGIYLTNALGIVFTLGLYTPWAQMRLARYRLGVTSVTAAGSLDEFAAAAESSTAGAAGEEISELFDVDFGF